jgi:hypothetical protein
MGLENPKNPKNTFKKHKKTRIPKQKHEKTTISWHFKHTSVAADA